MKKLSFLIVLAFLLSFTQAYSSSITGISSYTVGGHQMTGMNVTVNNGTASSGIWTTTGAQSGQASGASGDGWTLSFDGPDTWLGQWNLVSDTAITSFSIDAFNVAENAQIFFDIFDNHNPDPSGATAGGPNGLPDTPGSFRGYWDGNQPGGEDGVDGNAISGTSTINNANLSWAFTDAIEVGGNSAIDDLWGKLTVTFLNNPNGITDFSFRLDTDRSEIFDPSEVPEPTTAILFGLGLLGMVGMGRKKI